MFGYILKFFLVISLTSQVFTQETSILKSIVASSLRRGTWSESSQTNLQDYARSTEQRKKVRQSDSYNRPYYRPYYPYDDAEDLPYSQPYVYPRPPAPFPYQTPYPYPYPVFYPTTTTTTTTTTTPNPLEPIGYMLIDTYRTPLGSYSKPIAYYKAS